MTNYRKNHWRQACRHSNRERNFTASMTALLCVSAFLFGVAFGIATATERLDTVTGMEARP